MFRGTFPHDSICISLLSIIDINTSINKNSDVMLVQKACLMGESDLLVNFLEAEAVSAVLPDWPEGMQVAVCMTAEGGCDLAVHGEGEERLVLNRLAELHRTPLQAFCVSPEMAGFQSHKIFFSQEQDLLSLVAQSDDLTSLARDYALRHHALKDPSAAPVHISASLGEKASNPDDDTVSFIMPSGYAASIPDERPECMFLDARLERGDNTIRLIIAPGDRTGAEPVTYISQVGSRDDFGRFVLPLSVLDGWSHGASVVVDMPLAVFPEALLSRYLTGSHGCEVTVTACGVFFSANVPSQSMGPSAATGRNDNRRYFRPAHAAVAALVALMLVTGHFATARDKLDQSAPAQSFDAGVDAALELISAMAQPATPR